MKLIIAFSIFISGFLTLANSQNITNVLGTNGTYTIKSSTTNFLTATQSTGNVKIFNTLRMEATTGANVGVLYSGSDRFLHNFGFGCLYLGLNSGNYTTALFNNAAGQLTLFSNNGGSSNSAFGYLTMGFNTTGSNNSAFGYASLFFNSTAGNNSAFGGTSLTGNLSGVFNSAFGDSSLVQNTSGDSNCAFGSQSLALNTTGSQNSAFGRQSLLGNTTGNFNTAIGYLSGSTITTGSNLTCIGYNSQPTTGTAVNQVTLGNNSITSLRCNVTSITSLSDRRDKKNIKDLHLGIDFLMTLKPRLYNWDKREWYENGVSDGTKMQETPTAGFIAQELDDAQTSAGAEWLNLVLKDNPEKWEATPGNLMPVIVKAVQELKSENETLNKENDGLISENNELEKLLSEMEKHQNLLKAEIEKINVSKNYTASENVKIGKK